MDYFLIKGHFHVVGYSPDGDSLMFEAETPKDWELVQSKYSDLFQKKLEEGNGSVQLRLQGIDALETHYGPSPLPMPREVRGKKFAAAEKPKAKTIRQPKTLGDKATEKLLSYLGIEEHTWGSFRGRHWIKEIKVKTGKSVKTYTSKEHKGADPLEGYIVVNDIDRKGRPISWVFGEKTRRKSGREISTEDLLEDLKDSVNYRLVANGMVYPYFYYTLAAKLRNKLIHGSQNAQRQKMGIWEHDQSMQGITLERRSQLEEEFLIFPYLFRRMVKHQFKCNMLDYWESLKDRQPFAPESEGLFLDRFFTESNPYLFLIEEQEFVRLSEVISIRGNHLKMTTHPGNIVFLP